MTVLFGMSLMVSWGAILGSQAPTDPQEVIRAAAELADGGRIEEAVELYRKVLEQNESWFEGWLRLGELELGRRSLLSAREALSRAVAIRHASGEAWGLLGMAEFELREYRRALGSLSRSREFEANDNTSFWNEVRYHQALLLSRHQEFEVAFFLLFDLAYRLPGDDRLPTALGIAALRLPFLPDELPSDRREVVRRAGGALAHLADFRLAAARSEYQALFSEHPEFPNLALADPDMLLLMDPEAGFPINTSVEVRPASEVELGPEDLVIGVLVADQPRAYPVNYMNGPQNEVVNDVLGDTPIAATW